MTSNRMRARGMTRLYSRRTGLLHQSTSTSQFWTLTRPARIRTGLVATCLDAEPDRAVSESEDVVGLDCRLTAVRVRVHEVVDGAEPGPASLNCDRREDLDT